MFSKGNSLLQLVLLLTHCMGAILTGGREIWNRNLASKVRVESYEFYDDDVFFSLGRRGPFP